MKPNQAKAIIAANIQRLMRDRGMSQAELARESGENEMYVSRVVRGQREPTASRLHSFAVALGVRMEELLSDEQNLRQTG